MWIASASSASRWERRTRVGRAHALSRSPSGVEPALGLAAPAQRPSRPVPGRRAVRAADRSVTALVERVDRQLALADVRPDVVVRPVGERARLPELVALVPAELRRRPRGVGDWSRRTPVIQPVEARERGAERADLADRATEVGVPLPERVAVGRGLTAEATGPRRPRPRSRSAARSRATRAYVSGKSTWVSSAKTRAFGWRSRSMSRRTLSSFWNEHASATSGVERLEDGRRRPARRSGPRRRSRRRALRRSAPSRERYHSECLSMSLAELMRATWAAGATRPSPRPCRRVVSRCARPAGPCPLQRCRTRSSSRWPLACRRAARRVADGRARTAGSAASRSRCRHGRGTSTRTCSRRRRLDGRRHRARAPRREGALGGRARRLPGPVRRDRRHALPPRPRRRRRRPRRAHRRAGARRDALDYEQCAPRLGRDDWVDVLVDWFRRHGVPDDVTLELIEQGALVPAVHPLPARSRARSIPATTSTAGGPSPRRGTRTVS